MTGQNQPQLPETVRYSQQRESTVGEDYVTQGKFRYMASGNKFLNLFAMVLEGHKLKK